MHTTVKRNLVTSAFLMGLGITPVLSENLSAQDLSPNIGIVSFTLDDAYKNQHTNALPVMLKYKITGTLFIPTQNVGDRTDPDSIVMSWPEILDWKAAGWELGAHTHTHPYLTKLPETELNAELGYSAALIWRHTGTFPVSFASPYGDFDDRVLAAVRTIYEDQVSAWGGVEGIGDGFNALSSVDLYNIGRLGVERDTKVEKVCADISRAATEHYWLVLEFHQIVESPIPGDEGKYQIPVGNFEEIAKCAAEAAQNGKIRIATVQEVLRAALPTRKSTSLTKPSE